MKYTKERVMLRPKPDLRYQAEGGREEGTVARHRFHLQKPAKNGMVSPQQIRESPGLVRRIQMGP